MYYRRKILLSLLQEFGGSLDKIKIQKLLFLLSRFQKKPNYYFVPYKYGCYSFQCKADINTLLKYNTLLKEDNTIICNSDINFLSQIRIEDKNAIKNLRLVYGLKTTDELVKSTYISHPYFAINSVIAKDILNKEEYEKVLSARPKKQKIILYTIGYEGISLEEYLNKLILNDVKVLCDVRNNALSMKFGFSKSILKTACESVGIYYIHLPEVGIQSEFRKELNNQEDYDVLFDDYKNTVLQNTLDTQNKILELLGKFNRIALTCFEANICQCHRKPLADSISKLESWHYEIRHI